MRTLRRIGRRFLVVAKRLDVFGWRGRGWLHQIRQRLCQLEVVDLTARDHDLFPIIHDHHDHVIGFWDVLRIGSVRFETVLRLKVLRGVLIRSPEVARRVGVLSGWRHLGWEGL